MSLLLLNTGTIVFTFIDRLVTKTTFAPLDFCFHRIMNRPTGLCSIVLLSFGSVALVYLLYHQTPPPSSTVTTRASGVGPDCSKCFDEHLTDNNRPKEVAVVAPQAVARTATCVKPMPTIRRRSEIGAVLEKENFTTGAELGVQSGSFADEVLRLWPSAKEYLLVDLWRHQPRYKDLANVKNKKQERIRQDCMRRLQKYGTVIKVCQNYTTSCALSAPDG